LGAIPSPCRLQLDDFVHAVGRIERAFGLLADDRLLAPLETFLYRGADGEGESVGDADYHAPVVLLAGSRNPERALVDDAYREGCLTLE
jgi:hypothetical protein